MNKKIILSMLPIGVTLAMVTGATTALFSDTETSTGNTFTAGTIDISVDGENPWQGTGYFTIDDMKPSDAEYKDFVINNVGGNEVDVWKHIDVTDHDGGTMNEPECEEQGGTWVDDGAGSGHCDGGTEVSDISQVINYDLLVDGETIIDEAEDIQMSDVHSYWVYLGKIEPSESMDVTQSYHMQSTAGNEYQGDELDFNVELYAQQIRGCPAPQSPEYSGYGKLAGDDVDFGDPLSERGHINRDVDDWSYTQNGVPFTGTNYGGGDDGTFRLLMGAPTGCGAGHEHATFVMSACGGMSNKSLAFDKVVTTLTQDFRFTRTLKPQLDPDGRREGPERYQRQHQRGRKSQPTPKPFAN